MFGVFGTISGLDGERERKCQSCRFYSGEYVVVLMIIIMTPQKRKTKNKTGKKRNTNIPHKP